VTFNADEPAISGACYTVVDVDGHPPAALADFARDAAMTLLMNGQTRRVIGSGAHRSGSVRFHQKDPGPGRQGRPGVDDHRPRRPFPGRTGGRDLTGLRAAGRQLSRSPEHGPAAFHCPIRPEQPKTVGGGGFVR